MGESTLSQIPDDASDVGGDTQRRFRYQAACAALYAVRLLLDEPEAEALYCEYLDDIAVRYADGGFAGIQVKTRDGLGPFGLGDREVLESLAHFVTLDTKYQCFSRFVLVSNCGFRDTGEDQHDLSSALRAAKETGVDIRESHKGLTRLLGRLCEKTGKTREKVLGVLRKVQLEKFPDFPQIEGELLRRLGEIPALGEKTYSSLKSASRALVEEMRNAASLAHESVPSYGIALLEEPERQRAAEKMEGKRVTKQRVCRCIAGALRPQLSLRTWNHPSVVELLPGMGTLTLKMDAGAVSAANIDYAKDCKDSAEHWLATAIHRDVEIAQSLYEHVRTLVRTQCQEAHDDVRTGDAPYGQRMLTEVRSRLHSTHEREAASLLDCRYEHLLGIAAILTEECALWWSETFDMPGEAKG